MQTHCYELPIRILLSREGRDFVAHALELDLVSYGATEKAAVEELKEAMHAHMSYASQLDRPEEVLHPAPPEFFARWDEANRAALRGSVSKDRPVRMKTKAVFITMTEDEIRKAQRQTARNAFRREETLVAKVA